jgi:hypothetical protein
MGILTAEEAACKKLCDSPVTNPNVIRNRTDEIANARALAPTDSPRLMLLKNSVGSRRKSGTTVNGLFINVALPCLILFTIGQ